LKERSVAQKKSKSRETPKAQQTKRETCLYAGKHGTEVRRQERMGRKEKDEVGEEKENHRGIAGQGGSGKT